MAKVFLLAKGVGVDRVDTSGFPPAEKMWEFLGPGGEILACGTCLKLRDKGASELCPVSTEDLYRLVLESGRALTF